jgi:hypothetical protein
MNLITFGFPLFSSAVSSMKTFSYFSPLIGQVVAFYHRYPRGRQALLFSDSLDMAGSSPKVGGAEIADDRNPVLNAAAQDPGSAAPPAP